MDRACETKHHRLEELHCWFASRRDVVFVLVVAPANALLLQWVKAENRLLRHFNLPLGVSVFALAQKPA